MSKSTDLRLGLARTLLGAATMAAMLGSATSVSFAADKALLWVQPMRDHPVHRLMQAGFLDECKKLG